MRGARRFELAAWQVRECAKQWREADADVAEAIDFCRFYAAEMRRLRPHVVLTFAPDGAYGHPDHIAISQYTTAAGILGIIASSVEDTQPVFDAIARAVKKADALYLSTDPDREGEAIAFHIAEAACERAAQAVANGASVPASFSGVLGEGSYVVTVISGARLCLPTSNPSPEKPRFASGRIK